MEVRKAALFLDRLPTKPEAESIRKWCGIAKRIEYGPDELGAPAVHIPRPRRARRCGLMAGDFSRPTRPSASLPLPSAILAA